MFECCRGNGECVYVGGLRVRYTGVKQKYHFTYYGTSFTFAIEGFSIVHRIVRNAPLVFQCERDKVLFDQLITRPAIFTVHRYLFGFYEVRGTCLVEDGANSNFRELLRLFSSWRARCEFQEARTISNEGVLTNYEQKDTEPMIPYGHFVLLEGKFLSPIQDCNAKYICYSFLAYIDINNIHGGE